MAVDEPLMRYEEKRRLARRVGQAKGLFGVSCQSPHSHRTTTTLRVAGIQLCYAVLCYAVLCYAMLTMLPNAF